MVKIDSMPDSLEAKPGDYAIVALTAKVSRKGDLEELGKDLARKHSIARPKIEVLALLPRGDRYLIVVTRHDR